MIKDLLKNKKAIAILILALILIVLVYLIASIIQKERRLFQNQSQNVETEEEEKTGTEESAEKKTENQPVDYAQAAKNIEFKISNGTATNEDLLNLGIAYYNLQKPDQAIDAYKDLIVKDPNSAEAYKNLGNVLRDQKKYREAETSYRTAMRLDTKFVTAYINLAHMLFAIEENKAGALSVLEQGLAYNPDDATLKNLLSEYSK